MYIKNRAAALIVRIAALFSCGAGLYILSGISGGRIRWMNLVYFTNLSNLACLIFYIYLIAITILGIKKSGVRGAGSPNAFLRGALMMMTTVTMLVYHFMLSATGFVMLINANPLMSAANALLHYAAPCLVLIDWLLFDEKKRFKAYYPVCWLGIPAIYFIFTVIRAQTGGAITGTGSRYPYYFLDADALGISGVAVYLLMFAAGFAILGYLFYFIDNRGKKL